MIDLKDMYQVNDELVLTEFGDELALLNPTTGKYYVVNEVGKDILELMKVPIQLNEIINKMTSNYDVDSNKCEAEVLTFVEKMQGNGIVEKK